MIWVSAALMTAFMYILAEEQAPLIILLLRVHSRQFLMATRTLSLSNLIVTDSDYGVPIMVEAVCRTGDLVAVPDWMEACT